MYANQRIPIGDFFINLWNLFYFVLFSNKKNLQEYFEADLLKLFKRPKKPSKDERNWEKVRVLDRPIVPLAKNFQI